MVVMLRKIRRTAGRSRPKKYGFNEEDTLLRDLILYIEGLAFADEAFENDFQSPENVLQPTQPEPPDSSLEGRVARPIC